jgi:murein DD-endopeptidase MepM/ murein hydrolase activator NlpD
MHASSREGTFMGVAHPPATAVSPRAPRRLRILIVTASLALAAFAWAGGYALVTVRSGDTLGGIAARYGLPVDALLEANGLQDILVYPGDVLHVPLGTATGGVAEPAPEPPPGFGRHVLAEGETLSEITTRYGIELDALVGANPDLSSLDRLPVGVELLIPPGRGLLVTWRPGLDLAEVLRAHGADPVDVLRANQIHAPRDLRSGMLLWLPGVEPTAALERLARVREMENRYVWPVHGRITSYFGRRNLGFGTSSFHRGLDVAAPTGTPIVASRSGTVTFAGWSGSYGYLVRVRHGGGDETWYAHQSRILVSVGQWVEQNQIVGRVGSTGLSTGPHVHFEIRRQGRALDPLGELN